MFETSLIYTVGPRQPELQNRDPVLKRKRKSTSKPEAGGKHVGAKVSGFLMVF